MDARPNLPGTRGMAIMELRISGYAIALDRKTIGTSCAPDAHRQ
jgi:hypothetical protein